MQEGQWLVADSSFGGLREALKTARGLRIYEISLTSVPPHAQVQLHWDSTNFMLGAHLALQGSSDALSLCVHGMGPQSMRCDRAVIAHHTLGHEVRNDSDVAVSILSCFFYHPGVSDVECFALGLVAALANGLEDDGVEVLRWPG